MHMLQLQAKRRSLFKSYIFVMHACSHRMLKLKANAVHGLLKSS